jgi:hypothetical protein
LFLSARATLTLAQSLAVSGQCPGTFAFAAGGNTYTFPDVSGSTVLTNLTPITTARIWGRVSAGTGGIEQLTKTQMLTFLNVADGATALSLGTGSGNAYRGDYGNTAYTDRFNWDGGATGLTAATGRTSLELGNVTNESKATMFTNPVFSGSINSTGSRVTKGWYADLEVTNIPTVNGTAIVEDAIVDAVTTRAPSQNKVFDGLALKIDKSTLTKQRLEPGNTGAVTWNCAGGNNAFIATFGTGAITANVTITMTNLTNYSSGNLTIMNCENGAFTVHIDCAQASGGVLVAPNIKTTGATFTLTGNNGFDCFSWYFDDEYLWIKGTK